jgi:hypothetical protein
MEPSSIQSSLGDLARTIGGAIKDMEIARSECGDYLDAYDIAMTGCSDQDPKQLEA